MKNIEKKARKLMKKYPNMITVGELQKELPNEKERRDVFSKMVHLAHSENELGL